MENDLTSIIIGLNRMGRTPIRGEVKSMAQALSNKDKFGGSKGWLDKYLSRVYKEIKNKPEY